MSMTDTRNRILDPTERIMLRHILTQRLREAERDMRYASADEIEHRAAHQLYAGLAVAYADLMLDGDAAAGNLLRPLTVARRYRAFVAEATQ